MNKKFFTRSLLSMIAFLFLFGCATKSPVELPAFSAQKFDTTKYQSKVDNFMIVLDASSSMRDDYMGTLKLDTAKAVAERLNLTIPELGQTAGLRSFGHAASVCKNLTKLLYGMEKYNTAALGSKIGMLTEAGGFSPLDVALDAVQMDFEGIGGIHKAVIIISDGLDMTATVDEAQALKDKYGSSICFYPIQVGNAPEGMAFLKEIARIGDCGFLSNADNLMDSASMAAFVEKALLAKVMAKPAPPVTVVTPHDTDGDGVYDDKDQCPGTPYGARVNAVGCWTLSHVLFGYDKSVISAEAYPFLDEVAVILEKNPSMSVELQGHTDNIGSEKYNMGLSLRRAKAVADYLVNKGIQRNRLATTGFGFSKPVALNGTDFGRSLNRRVEISPY